MNRTQIRKILGPSVDRIFQALDGTPALKKLAQLSHELYATLKAASRSPEPLIDRVRSRLVDSRQYSQDLKRSLDEMVGLRHPRDRARLKSILYYDSERVYPRPAAATNRSAA
jgi:hypothetical protein